MAKKRRKTSEQKTVRMRRIHFVSRGFTPFKWSWKPCVGRCWFNMNSPVWCATKGGAKQSGNAWLRRLGKQFGVKLAPAWE
jgi:hypothetical protein